MCSPLFELSIEENVTVKLLLTSNCDKLIYCSDMRVVAGLRRPRCCGRAGERVPIATMNLLRRVWVSETLIKFSHIGYLKSLIVNETL